MVPEKRKLMVVTGAIVAALALPGCAPAGYNAADYGTGAASAAEPAANAVDTPPSAAAVGDTNEEQDAPAVSKANLTTELNGTTVARMGDVVKDQKGWVLYRFDKDNEDPSKSNCDGDCAKLWPPALTDGEPKLDGVSSDDVGTVQRTDGTKQLTLGGWPLYRYIGDKKAGQWKGQNVGGVWFVVRPDGKKNLTCLPKISKPVALPDDAASESDELSGDAGNDAGKDSGKDSGSESSGTDYNY